MRSIDRFIITPKSGELYNNKKEVGQSTLIVNTSIEHAEDVNREAIIVEVPIEYNGDLQKGDTVIVQHNIFRMYYDERGIPRTSTNHIRENLYYADADLIYLGVRDGDTFGIDDNVFIEPITETDKWLGDRTAPHLGIVRYTNRKLKKSGIKEGQHIVYRKNCEYAHKINGQLLYKMANHRILVALDR